MKPKDVHAGSKQPLPGWLIPAIATLLGLPLSAAVLIALLYGPKNGSQSITQDDLSEKAKAVADKTFDCIESEPKLRDTLKYVFTTWSKRGGHSDAEAQYIGEALTTDRELFVSMFTDQPDEDDLDWLERITDICRTNVDTKVLSARNKHHPQSETTPLP